MAFSTLNMFNSASFLSGLKISTPPTLAPAIPAAIPIPLTASAISLAGSALPTLPSVSPGLLQAINGLVPSAAPVVSGTGPKINSLGIKSTDLKTATGTPDNKSLVSIPFSSGIQLADPSKLSIVGAALDPSTNTLITKNIPILDAKVDPQNAKNLLLTTGVILPTGAAITVDNGALKDSAGKPIAKQIGFSPSGDGINHFSVANHFAPTNVNMFTNDAFTNATVAPFATGNGPDEATAKNQLSGFLDKKVAAGQIDAAKKATLLTQYSSTQAKTIIPNPNLRASLFSLGGSVADTAIANVLTGVNQSGKPYKKIDFDPSVTAIDAGPSIGADGSISIKLNPNLKAESFEQIGPLLAHEVLHQDNTDGLSEEVTANALQTFTYAQNLKLDPSAAKANTLLTRGNNTLLLAMLNSGNRAFPTPGISSAPGVQTTAGVSAQSRAFIGPTGVPAQSFLDYVGRTYSAIGTPNQNTVGNSYLNSALSAITQTSVTGKSFDPTSYQLLDAQQKTIGVNDVINLGSNNKLSNALNLTLA